MIKVMDELHTKVFWQAEILNKVKKPIMVKHGDRTLYGHVAKFSPDKDYDVWFIIGVDYGTTPETGVYMLTYDEAYTIFNRMTAKNAKEEKKALQSLRRYAEYLKI